MRLSHLGDVVHALPLYHALAARFETACIVWVIQQEYAELVRPLARLERVVEFDRRGGARAWLELREELASFAPTLVIDAQGNLKSAAAALAAGSGERVGAAWSDWREPLGAFAMHMRADRSRGPHAVDRVLALAREVCGGEVEARFDLELSRDERARGDELVARFLPETKDAVILALGTPDDVRAWPAEHAANLARRLAANGRSVVVLSGPTERESGAKVELELAGVERVRHWVGQRGLRELAAFFAAAAARGARFVGCDSGPMHLAWTSGLRVICLEGPQSAERTGPWPQGDGSPHVALTARVPPACVPCFARTCEHPNGNVCMRDLAVDDVFEALTS